jgi:hypothetical protein
MSRLPMSRLFDHLGPARQGEIENPCVLKSLSLHTQFAAQLGTEQSPHFALRLAILTVWASIEILKRDRKLNPKSPSTP